MNFYGFSYDFPNELVLINSPTFLWVFLINLVLINFPNKFGLNYYGIGNRLEFFHYDLINNVSNVASTQELIIILSY
jgi:hypothetical protein